MKPCLLDWSSTSTLLVGFQAGTTTLEISLAIPQKIGSISTRSSSNTSLGHCLSQVFYSWTKYHDQEASWGGEGLFGLHFHIAVHHQRKSGLELKPVRKQELMQRPWRDVPYWFASSALLSLLSYRTKTTSPGMVPPTRGLSPLITN